MFLSSNKNSAYCHHSSSAYFPLLFFSSLKLRHPPIMLARSCTFKAHGDNNSLVPLAHTDLACSLLQTRDPPHHCCSWERESWGSAEAKDFQLLWKLTIGLLQTRRKASMQSRILEHLKCGFTQGSCTLQAFRYNTIWLITNTHTTNDES